MTSARTATTPTPPSELPLGSMLLGERLIAIARGAASLHAAREAAWLAEDPLPSWSVLPSEEPATPSAGSKR